MAGEIVLEKRLVCKLLETDPVAHVIKNNPNYIQGFPDRILLYKNFWAAFETKTHAGANVQPNQEFYIDQLNRLSLAMFVYPENEKEFLREVQYSLQFKG